MYQTPSDSGYFRFCSYIRRSWFKETHVNLNDCGVELREYNNVRHTLSMIYYLSNTLSAIITSS